MATQFVKQRYSIDLVAQQALCEHNYARLMKLLPRWDRVDEQRYGIHYGEHQASVCFLIQQRCPFTSMLEVSHEADWGHWLAPPVMQVRVYHDLRMAEVVSTLNRQHLAARYDYPNSNMDLPDEKAQWNRFLGEWLSHCIEGGVSLDSWNTASL
ncbi:DUF1249 domain-containing protein [Aestuariirhabdus sp. Z084]|uniref:DUF1249 domain-containing protein n=1 Tax=Aestuariirhabdus haliotis TaxID=2918751 RepID=UPI00201B3E6E|nr:DUF1249 domain-containing protein [Aestuariirhabdus haliotis]MCL6415612.1 DUF1249 domain-containing protein [Aestuariirhabdus haliotis]MCL6419607.1 DUF1249 domain-containing protein [Aestuariirhabdus haliotis]